MKKYVILISLFLLTLSLAAQAYFLNSGEIISAQKGAAQIGYVSKDFGSQISTTRGGIELKGAFGINDPWNILAYYVIPTGSGAGPGFNSLGLQAQYGMLKGDPCLSLIGGIERTYFSNSAWESNYLIGIIAGKSYSYGGKILFPFLGIKNVFISPSAGAQVSRDLEVSAGFKAGISPFWDLYLEGGYHWITRGSSSNNVLNVSMGLAWNLRK